MKLPKLEELNNPRFLDEAFIPEKNAQWIRASRLRRNVYLVLFLIGNCLRLDHFIQPRLSADRARPLPSHALARRDEQI